MAYRRSFHDPDFAEPRLPEGVPMLDWPEDLYSDDVGAMELISEDTLRYELTLPTRGMLSEESLADIFA